MFYKEVVNIKPCIESLSSTLHIVHVHWLITTIIICVFIASTTYRFTLNVEFAGTSTAVNSLKAELRAVAPQ